MKPHWKKATGKPCHMCGKRKGRIWFGEPLVGLCAICIDDLAKDIRR